MIAGLLGVAVGLLLIALLAAAGERGWLPLYPSPEVAGRVRLRPPWDPLPSAGERNATFPVRSPAGGDGVAP